MNGFFGLSQVAVVLLMSLIGAPLVQAGEEAKELLKVEGKLTDGDPTDAKLKKSFQKVQLFKAEAGKAYRIDLVSKAFDTILRVEDATGKQIELDDDGGFDTNSRIVLVSPNAQEYRLIATSYEPSATGPFTLTVREATKAEVTQYKVQHLPTLPAAERRGVVSELKKDFASKQKDLTPSQVNLVLMAALDLESKDARLAEEIYRDFAVIFSGASDANVSGAKKTMEGAVRRLQLPGKAMELKGTTLDGKPFDWSSYKGKVVLVDFWATWCGPCLQELPNVEKMYKAYHGRGFEVVGISLDYTEEDLTKFLAKQPLPWPCLFEKDGKGQNANADYYGVYAIPQAMLVGRDGTVVSLQASGAELHLLLEKMLGPLEEKK